MRPVKWTAMQVHHGLYVKRIGLNGIDNRVRKAIEVEFAVFVSDFTPAAWVRHNAKQRAVELLEKIFS